MQTMLQTVNLKKKRSFFQKNGVVIFKNLIPRSIIKKCLSDLNKFDDLNYPKDKNIVLDRSMGKKYIRYFQYLNLYVKSFDAFFNSKILNISSHLLNDNSYFSSMNYHNKVPGGEGTPPHQDNFYWCRKPNKALTAYIALNDQSNKNGGIEYFLGSHKLKTFEHLSSTVKGFSSFIEQKKIPDLQILKPNLKMGDVIFHHCNVIHKAGKNNHKTVERKALALAIYSFKSKINDRMLKKYKKNKLTAKNHKENK